MSAEKVRLNVLVPQVVRERLDALSAKWSVNLTSAVIRVVSDTHEREIASKAAKIPFTERRRLERRERAAQEAQAREVLRQQWLDEVVIDPDENPLPRALEYMWSKDGVSIPGVDSGFCIGTLHAIAVNGPAEFVWVPYYLEDASRQISSTNPPSFPEWCHHRREATRGELLSWARENPPEAGLDLQRARWLREGVANPPPCPEDVW